MNETDTEITETTPAPPATETVASEPTAPEPHPLDPGGRRFSEVYRDMQDARRAEASALARAAAAEAQLAASASQAAPQFYTAAQLQTYVDAGQLTPAAMAERLAWQATQASEQRVVAQLDQRDLARQASAEVSQYATKVPKLLDRSSEEFGRVYRAAVDVQQEYQRRGVTVSLDDPTVQRRALREALGPLDRIVARTTASEAVRQSADTYVETAGGGGVAASAPAADPLKDVPIVYQEHWARLGYTRAQMLDEAKYIKPTVRARLASR